MELDSVVFQSEEDPSHGSEAADFEQSTEAHMSSSDRFQERHAWLGGVFLFETRPRVVHMDSRFADFEPSSRGDTYMCTP